MASTSEQLCRLYSLADIQQATQNFDDGLLIGHGGFGKVYKGDVDGESGSSTTVAFKRLDSMSDQGAPEFRAEIEVLSKLRHAHLVSLLGCCEEDKEMILVYEYMPNGTLYHHLHNSDTQLSWMQRLRIGIGAARGLDYLHTGVGTKHGIIHRDVKSSNILLDEDWAAKISDFGLAKLCPINQLSTYVHTGIKGTFGYLDPEIFMTGKFTRKTDVFAFGVVLFELLSGRRAVLPEDDEDLSLARWAQNCVKGRKLDQIVDTEIRGTLSPKCLKEFVQIGYRCLQSVPKERPTMSEVVATLQLSLALQEKFESSVKPSGLFGLSWKMSSYIFPQKKENSGHIVPSDDGDSNKKRLSERKHHTTNFQNASFSDLHGEQVAAGWPAWLSAVAGEAINGWIPLRADTFEKLDKIGEGTSSNVYKARDIMTGKIVALKRVRFNLLEPESVRYMAREIIILRRLDHPNVVKLEGLITSRMSSSLYLVFEYMDHDLAGLAASPMIKFTEPQVKSYMHQLLSGLEHCHNRYVLHRDITGSNLLLDNDGCLKIADFGSATFFDPRRKQPMTSRVVTLWYRPPELLLGTTDYGVGIDLWSAGCIFGELLVRKPIMPGRTEVEQLHKIFKLCGSPSEGYWKKLNLPHATVFKPQHPYKRRIAETFENISPSSLSLIDTLLAIDPEERQTTTAALRSEFFMTEPYACDPSGFNPPKASA